MFGNGLYTRSAFRTALNNCCLGLRPSLTAAYEGLGTHTSHETLVYPRVVHVNIMHSGSVENIRNLYQRDGVITCGGAELNEQKVQYSEDGK